MQKYVNNPFLVGGKKFDLRIYVLVTSYSPLTVYLYRTGFARFTHHRYSDNAEDIQNSHMHLTNVAIQKTSNLYNSSIGGKWDLRMLKLYLTTKYGQELVNRCFHKIQQIFVKTLQSVQKVIINDKHCFELYGYDILLDSHLKPWLVEVNASPSMTANTEMDHQLKLALLDDVFTIVDLEGLLTGQEEQVGGFDLIFKGAPVARQRNFMYQTYLGAFNNREASLKELAKQAAQRLSASEFRQSK